MNTFKLTISSPDGNMFEGDVVKFDVRGIDGELAVMAGHIPFVTMVIKAPCTIWFEDGSRRNAFSDSGVLTVSEESTTFLSGSFKFLDK